MSTAKTKSKSGNPIRRFLGILGPGFITGASVDDPSGIGTYAVAGASTGFGMLWLALVTFPLMVAIQFICAKIAMVTGRGLAGVLKEHYSRWLLYPAVLLLVITNIINAGADIGAIAAAINMMVPIPIPAMIIPVALLIVVLQFWGSYSLIERIFKWLTLALFAYVATAFFTKPGASEVLKGTFIPAISFDNKFLVTTTAILGTTISPYLFFWQTGQEIEEEKRIGRTAIADRRGTTKAQLKRRGWDVLFGMLFSNVVMYFIILTTAATLFKADKTNIQSATDAAEALKPLAGAGAKFLLGLGLIGTGFLAVPILTGSSGYALAEVFGWKHGLEHKPGQAKKFYWILAISTAAAIEINFLGINPVTALVWAAVINGLLAPPLLVLIMLIGNRKKIMKEHTNGVGLNVLGWATTLAMSAAAIALVASWFRG
jgi:NRAMP (natural resistance-associated macrophage protein)-like metal ion transporter